MCISTIRSILIFFLTTLLITIRPLLGPRGVCLFEVTCVEYACQQLNEQTFITALKNICKRLYRCQPFTT